MATTAKPDAPPGAVDDRRRWQREIVLVLALSLGASAVFALVQLVANLTAPGGLSNQTSSVIVSQSPREYVDLTYQVLDIVYALVPVALAVHLLSAGVGGVPGRLRAGWARIGLAGLSRRQVLAGIGWGLLIAACIGGPGLGLVYLARDLGINTNVVVVDVARHWWTVPVLVGSAVENALLEEVVVVGFLITRLRELGRSNVAAVVVSAVVRGSYHLYQGFGGFAGNAVMGLVFGTWFVKRRSVLSLFVAHATIDSVAFVGYYTLKSRLNLP